MLEDRLSQAGRVPGADGRSRTGFCAAGAGVVQAGDATPACVSGELALDCGQGDLRRSCAAAGGTGRRCPAWTGACGHDPGLPVVARRCWAVARAARRVAAPAMWLSGRVVTWPWQVQVRACP